MTRSSTFGGAVFDRGMLTIKLYMMVGLPTETDEDLDEDGRSGGTHQGQDAGAGRRFGRAGTNYPFVNGFVPKPNTPLQWDSICDEKE